MTPEKRDDGAIGGIPSYIFHEQNSVGRFRGLITGEWIDYQIRPNNVWIAANTRKVKFYAFRIDGSMELMVRTKGYKNDWNKRHPDFYAKDLLNSTIEYFGQFQHIDTIVGRWKKEGHLDDNYRAYIDHVPPNPTQADKLLAASQTWTGTVLSKNHEFTCTGIQEYRMGGKDEAILALFQR